ncbi:alpha/beta hydrolase family protein [Planctomicrobium piriforme]|uniref:Alpha/beta hydrolase n=1 Tax=Planctomicrobium piriforme TaxID=1576369 RepID=A0A1I3BJP4_9PLAN|nr:alpha/beta hydrolase [Planctomicrobium piriforme]SFH62544.1 Alpha/beta hydrolase of unknown function [Planctomicrobium piriforme]
MRLSVIFCLRVLIFSLLAWPVLAEGTDSVVESQQPSQLAVLNADSLSLELPPPLPEAKTEFISHPIPESAVETLPPVESQPCTGTYWIVSSRQSVQTIHEACRGPWGLNVYQRLPDGQLVCSDMPSLASQIDPTLPVCIFVHGSFVQWESQCREAHALYQRMAACYAGKLQMIFFTWPSDGPYTHCFHIDVAIRGRRADFNGFHLGYLLSQLPPTSPVTMIGHSHGARLILATMQLAGGGSIEGHYFPYSMGAGRRYRAVLAAGAMDHNWLNPGQPYACALNPLECLMNLRNRQDLPLSVYPLSRPFAHRAVARSGFTRHDINAIGPNAAKLRDVDVTPWVGHAHLWPEYYRQPAILATIMPYLYY